MQARGHVRGHACVTLRCERTRTFPRRTGSQPRDAVARATQGRVASRCASSAGAFMDESNPPCEASLGEKRGALGRSAAGKKSGASCKDSLAFFAITSPSVHSAQRPENINNLYPIVTSRRESKRANVHRDWSHLALRKPATSRAIAGSYGGHRFSSAMHGKRIIIQTLHPAPELARIIPPQELSHLVWRGRAGQLSRRLRRRGAGGGDVGTITLLKR